MNYSDLPEISEDARLTDADYPAIYRCVGSKDSPRLIYTKARINGNYYEMVVQFGEEPDAARLAAAIESIGLAVERQKKIVNDRT